MYCRKGVEASLVTVDTTRHVALEANCRAFWQRFQNVTLSLRCPWTKGMYVPDGRKLFERRGAAPFPHALAPSSLNFHARLAMTPTASLEGVRLPRREPYTHGRHDRRDSQTRSALGRVHRRRRDEARPALPKPSAGSLEEPVVKTMPPSPMLSANVLATLADHRQSTPQGRIGNWKRVCAGGRAHRA